MLAASIEPSPPPAPTSVWISSMKRTKSPSLFITSFITRQALFTSLYFLDFSANRPRISVDLSSIFCAVLYLSVLLSVEFSGARVFRSTGVCPLARVWVALQVYPGKQ